MDERQRAAQKALDEEIRSRLPRRPSPGKKTETYVYRLVVKYPEHISDEACAERTQYLYAPVDFEVVRNNWKWPRERVYLSPGAAWSRAYKLRNYGCEVTVERSKKVEWEEVDQNKIQENT